MFVPRCQLSPALCWGQTPFFPSAGHGPAPGSPDVVLAMAPALSLFLGGPHEASVPTRSPWGALWVSALLLLVQERMPRANKQVGGSFLKKHGTSAFGRNSHSWRCSKERKSPVQPQQCNCPREMSRLVLPSASLTPPCTRLPLAIPCHSGTGLGEVCWDFVMVCIIQRLPNGPCHLAVIEKRFPGERSEVCT